MEPTSPLMVVLLLLMGALLAAITYFACTLPFGPSAKPDEAKPAKPEESQLLIPKEIIVLEHNAVDEFLRKNRLYVTLEHCFHLLYAMPNRDVQLFRLYTLLGKAVFERPGKAYVVRMGR